MVSSWFLGGWADADNVSSPCRNAFETVFGYISLRALALKNKTYIIESSGLVREEFYD